MAIGGKRMICKGKTDRSFLFVILTMALLALVLIPSAVFAEQEPVLYLDGDWDESGHYVAWDMKSCNDYTLVSAMTGSLMQRPMQTAGE